MEATISAPAEWLAPNADTTTAARRPSHGFTSSLNVTCWRRAERSKDCSIAAPGFDTPATFRAIASTAVFWLPCGRTKPVK